MLGGGSKPHVWGLRPCVEGHVPLSLSNSHFSRFQELKLKIHPSYVQAWALHTENLIGVGGFVMAPTTNPLTSTVIEHFLSVWSGHCARMPACARSRMFDYVYTDHAQYTIKMMAKMALFPLVLTSPLSVYDAVPAQRHSDREIGRLRYREIYTGACTDKTT